MVKKYGDLYLQARRALLPTEGENAAAAARELLAFASGKSVAAVLADANLYASEQIEADLNGYVNRMLAHEPLPYILRQWDFYGISLEVTPDVLIPRDDTMAVTDLALEVLRTGHPPPRVLDLCCGSGCIGLAIAHQLPDAHVTLADISRPALAVAKRNIKRLKLMNRVTAIGLDAKKPAPSFVGTLDALVCNPPYVTAEEMTQLEPSVRDYEPALALDGGLFAMGQNMNVIVDRFNGTACGWGNNFWLVIALAVNFAIMAFGVGGGIERANKVMMPVLFFLFAGLGVYIATLPGAGDGYRYIFTLDPAGLADPKLWIYAFGQAFFSLSVAGNGTVIYGSYFSDDESIPSAARNVALFDTLAALLAANGVPPARKE